MIRKIILVCLTLLITLTCFLFGCKDGEILLPERKNYTAQVGYEYDLYGNFGENSSIKDSNGNLLTVKYGKVFFEDTGVYKLNENGVEHDFTVVDTEAPMFKMREKTYSFSEIIPVEIVLGSEVDLNTIFIPVDNGNGKITVTYKVYRAGYELIQLKDNSKFTVEDKAGYVVDAYAGDESGNSYMLRQKLVSVVGKETLAFLFGEYDYCIEQQGTYSGFTVIPCEYQVGTPVKVSGKILAYFPQEENFFFETQNIANKTTHPYTRVTGVQNSFIIGHSGSEAYRPFTTNTWTDFEISVVVSGTGSVPDSRDPQLSTESDGVIITAWEIGKGDYILLKNITVERAD